MNDLKYRLLNGWNLMRILRLGLGIVIGFEAVKNSDALLGVFGIILLTQSVFNVGCCAAGACYVKPTNNKVNDKEISYEEIKKA